MNKVLSRLALRGIRPLWKSHSYLLEMIRWLELDSSFTTVQRLLTVIQSSHKPCCVFKFSSLVSFLRVHLYNEFMSWSFNWICCLYHILVQVKTLQLHNKDVSKNITGSNIWLAYKKVRCRLQKPFIDVLNMLSIMSFFMNFRVGVLLCCE